MSNQIATCNTHIYIYKAKDIYKKVGSAIQGDNQMCIFYVLLKF